MPPIMIRCVVGSLGGPFPAAGGAESRSADLGKGFPQASLKKEQRHFAAFVFSLPLTAPRVLARDPPSEQRARARCAPAIYACIACMIEVRSFITLPLLLDYTSDLLRRRIFCAASCARSGAASSPTMQSGPERLDRLSDRVAVMGVHVTMMPVSTGAVAHGVAYLAPATSKRQQPGAAGARSKGGGGCSNRRTATLARETGALAAPVASLQPRTKGCVPARLSHGAWPGPARSRLDSARATHEFLTGRRADLWTRGARWPGAVSHTVAGSSSVTLSLACRKCIGHPIIQRRPLLLLLRLLLAELSHTVGSRPCAGPCACCCCRCCCQPSGALLSAGPIPSGALDNAMTALVPGLLPAARRFFNSASQNTRTVYELHLPNNTG
jgi:hypothetical protein